MPVGRSGTSSSRSPRFWRPRYEMGSFGAPARRTRPDECAHAVRVAGLTRMNERINE
jgi:hypothetical protein